MKNLRHTTKDSLRKKGCPAKPHDPQDLADAKVLEQTVIVKNYRDPSKSLTKSHSHLPE